MTKSDQDQQQATILHGEIFTQPRFMNVNARSDTGKTPAFAAKLGLVLVLSRRNTMLQPGSSMVTDPWETWAAAADPRIGLGKSYKMLGVRQRYAATDPLAKGNARQFR
jgi:hypothetical protein